MYAPGKYTALSDLGEEPALSRVLCGILISGRFDDRLVHCRYVADGGHDVAVDAELGTFLDVI